jgi:glycosyltransferase involved in cell wall biosynthesis
MLIDLASRPRETRAEHAVALFSADPTLSATLADAGLRIHHRSLVSEGPLHFLWRSLGPLDVAWLANVLSAESADLVHLHTAASQVLGTRAARRCGVRVLRTEHSTRVYDDRSLWPFARWALRRADSCVAVSDHVRRVAAERAPWAASKMRVVCNGVDAERFRPEDRSRSELFTFVSMGRLEPRKGLDLAISALARTTGARLEIVGDGPSRSALEGLAARLGVRDRVTFHGFSRDPRPYWGRADAALCSARSEGLGIALLEAMAMGVPVVGFAVGGVSEIVRDGLTGLLAKGHDAAALAAIMNEANSDRERLRVLGGRARERVSECFSVTAMCEGYARAYEEVASHGKGESS